MIMLASAFVLFLLSGIVTALDSSASRNHPRDDDRLERRNLLGGLASPGGIFGAAQSFLRPGSSSLLQSPEGLLGSTPSSIYRGPPLRDTLGYGSQFGSPFASPFGSASFGGPPPTTYGDAPFSLPEQTYRSMLTCPGGVGGPRGVVLLAPPTGGHGGQVWPKSPYGQLLPQQGFSVCWVDNPTRSTGDAQLTAEFVAHAIKTLAAQVGGPISVITWSQGGINVQWVLAFWPSTRALVRSLITLAAPFHGTVADLVCPLLEVAGGCLPSVFQQMSSSRFLAALNAPVYGSGASALVPTTSIYSYHDEVVPALGKIPASYMAGAVNVALQQVCGSLHVVDHFLIVGDYAAYSIALNALLNGGVANLAALDRSTICNPGAGLGYQVSALANDLKYAFATVIGNPMDRVKGLLTTLTTLTVPTEPALMMYVCERGFATGCSATAPSGLGGALQRAPILSSLPQTIHGLGPVVGNLLGGITGRR